MASTWPGEAVERGEKVVVYFDGGAVFNVREVNAQPSFWGRYVIPGNVRGVMSRELGLNPKQTPARYDDLLKYMHGKSATIVANREFAHVTDSQYHMPKWIRLISFSEARRLQNGLTYFRY